jgi:hypothetical protein
VEVTNLEIGQLQHCNGLTILIKVWFSKHMMIVDQRQTWVKASMKKYALKNISLNSKILYFYVSVRKKIQIFFK